MSEPIFTVTAQAIVALDPFRCRDEDFGQIAGINVRPDGKGGALLVALDGHMCALLHEPFSACDAQVTITPSTAFVRALRDATKGANGNLALVRFDGERLSLLVGGEVILDQHDHCIFRGDGKDYPAISFVQDAQSRRKTGYKASSLAIPYEAMKPFQKAAAVYGASSHDHALYLYPSGPENPCLVRMGCNENFLGVVMPMMLDDETTQNSDDALARFEGLDALDAA